MTMAPDGNLCFYDKWLDCLLESVQKILRTEKDVGCFYWLLLYS